MMFGVGARVFDRQVEGGLCAQPGLLLLSRRTMLILRGLFAALNHLFALPSFLPFPLPLPFPAL